MTAPSTPYVTTALAGILSKNMFRGQAPNANTSVSATELAQLITWTDSMLDADFSSIGYKIPFQAISGETWPTFQTTFLQFCSAIGSMAMSTGYILSPAPMLVAGRASGDRNAYAILIESFRVQIRENGFRFRAQYWPGTRAEKNIATKYGPFTDFMKDKFDPTRYELLRDFTTRIESEFAEVAAMQIDWDYVYSLRA